MNFDRMLVVLAFAMTVIWYVITQILFYIFALGDTLRGLLQ